MENPIKMDDLGVSLFSATAKCIVWVGNAMTEWPLLKVPSQVSGGLQNAIGWAKEAASSPAGESWSKDRLWQVPRTRAKLRYLLNKGCFLASYISCKSFYILLKTFQFKSFEFIIPFRI